MKKKSKRKHIPALNPAELEQAIERLKDAKLPPAAKRTLEAMMRAASNPANETVEVILRTLPKHRQERIKRTANTVHKHMQSVTDRAKQALLDMPDAEWDRLVEEANQDD